jgi:hypothetical protein
LATNAVVPIAALQIRAISVEGYGRHAHHGRNPIQ